MPPHREVRASHTDDCITVYQAYSDAIAEAALASQTLVEPFQALTDDVDQAVVPLDGLSLRWATKSGQERVLAIQITETASSGHSRTRAFRISSSPPMQPKRTGRNGWPHHPYAYNGTQNAASSTRRWNTGQFKSDYPQPQLIATSMNGSVQSSTERISVIRFVSSSRQTKQRKPFTFSPWRATIHWQPISPGPSEQPFPLDPSLLSVGRLRGDFRANRRWAGAGHPRTAADPSRRAR